MSTCPGVKSEAFLTELVKRWLAMETEKLAVQQNGAAMRGFQWKIAGHVFRKNLIHEQYISASSASKLSASRRPAFSRTTVGGAAVAPIAAFFDLYQTLRGFPAFELQQRLNVYLQGDLMIRSVEAN